MGKSRRDGFHAWKKWKYHDERSVYSYSSRRDQSGQNLREGRLISGHGGGRSRNEIFGRFWDRKQRLDCSKQEDSSVDRKRIVRREEVRKYDRGRNARANDKSGEENDVWRRNLVHLRQERSYIAPGLRKYEGRSEVSRNNGEDLRSFGVDKVSSAARTEGKGLDIKKPEKKIFDPVGFQRLILSKGFNKPKQVDTNRNVIWGEKVGGVIEDNESESLDEETIFKDYSFKEYSGLVPSVCKNSVEDLTQVKTCKRRLEQKSDLVSSDANFSKRRMVTEVSRKRKFFRSENQSRSSSTNIDSQLNNLDNTTDDDIDNDYMDSVMKNIVSKNAEGERGVKLRDSSAEISTSEDSEDDADTFQPVRKSKLPSSSSSPHLDHRDYSSHRSSPDSNVSLKSVAHSYPNSGQSSPSPKVKTLNARFSEFNSEMLSDSHVEDKSSFSGLPSPPSPRPAQYYSTVRIKTKQGVDKREAKKVCSTRLYQSEAVQNQNKRGWKRSPDSVRPAVSQKSEVKQCKIKSTKAEETVNDHGQKESVRNEDKVIAIRVVDVASQVEENKSTEVEVSHTQEPSGLVTQAKIIVVVKENESDVNMEEKYEEPSPEIFEHDDLRADTRYTPITRKMHNVVVGAMHNINDVVVSRHNIDITKHDLFTLTGDNWLNDKIVEMFLTMIAQRSVSLNYVSRQHPKIHSMSTYFYTNLSTRGYPSVKKWTKEVDIFSYDMVLVPIHMDKHWSLACIDFRVPGVFYYDSLGSTVNDNNILSALLHYLSEEHMDKRGEEINLSKFAKHAMDTPLQQNGSDCGVFCCKVGDFLSRDLQLKFCQDDIKYFRKRMIFEILKGVLLEP